MGDVGDGSVEDAVIGYIEGVMKIARADSWSLLPAMPGTGDCILPVQAPVADQFPPCIPARITFVRGEGHWR